MTCLFFNILEDSLECLKVTVYVANDRLHAWLSRVLQRPARRSDSRSHPAMGVAAEDTGKTDPL